ncbi:inorganic polyphosphate/ATP-NAD kinase [Flammeovirgaceae bacterium 311]|nr:inorganic polyphosphate/ATP-NAD kinase [Flammeovirgaceae bacterium 311]
MKIALHAKAVNPDSVFYIQQVFDELSARGAELYISKPLQKNLSKFEHSLPDARMFSRNDSLEGMDFIFSLGGDGTLLDTVTYVGDLGIPIVGINTGRLGFLATMPKDGIREVIDALYNNYFSYEYRTLIHLDADQDLFEGRNFGLNDFTILKKDTSSMIVVHTYIDGEFLNSYWADGLIVATPTGSTGYSLSCGGPLVLPQSNNFVVTPVSPHNLYVRPMVVSDNSVISFEIEGRSNHFLVSLDSRSRTVDAGIQMAVRKEKFRAKLVKLTGYNFFDTLRQKLNWGLDNRN